MSLGTVKSVEKLTAVGNQKNYNFVLSFFENNSTSQVKVKWVYQVDANSPMKSEVLTTGIDYAINETTVGEGISSGGELVLKTGGTSRFADNSELPSFGTIHIMRETSLTQDTDFEGRYFPSGAVENSLDKVHFILDEIKSNFIIQDIKITDKNQDGSFVMQIITDGNIVEFDLPAVKGVGIKSITATNNGDGTATVDFLLDNDHTDSVIFNMTDLANYKYEQLVGAIIPMSTDTTMDDHLVICDGRWLDKGVYNTLFGKIGDKYLGADTARTNEFKVPDLRDQFLKGVNDPADIGKTNLEKKGSGIINEDDGDNVFVFEGIDEDPVTITDSFKASKDTKLEPDNFLTIFVIVAKPFNIVISALESYLGKLFYNYNKQLLRVDSTNTGLAVKGILDIQDQTGAQGSQVAGVQVKGEYLGLKHLTDVDNLLAPTVDNEVLSYNATAQEYKSVLIDEVATPWRHKFAVSGTIPIAVGDWVYFDGTNWQKASQTVRDRMSIGVVIDRVGASITVQFGGMLKNLALADSSGVALQAGEYYFLTTNGKITKREPLVLFSNPVIFCISSGVYFLPSFRPITLSTDTMATALVDASISTGDPAVLTVDGVQQRVVSKYDFELQGGKNLILNGVPFDPTLLARLPTFETAPYNDGDTWVYNSTDNEWKHQPSSAGVSSMDALTDTNITVSALAQGMLLSYNATTSKWVAIPAPTYTLNGLTDTDLTSLADGQMLVYDLATATWKNSALDLTPYLKEDGTVPMTGDLQMGGKKIENIVDSANSTGVVSRGYVDGLLSGLGKRLAPVKDLVTVPVGGEADGTRYLVVATATGAFTGKEGQIATVTGGAWAFQTVNTGDSLFVDDRSASYRYDGAIWVRDSAVISSNYLRDDGTSTLPTGYAPTQDLQVATKKMVEDATIAKLDDIGDVNVNLPANKALVSWSQANSKWEAILPSTLANFVKVDGSLPLTADWDVGGFEIKNAKEPTTTNSVATKKYVDDENIVKAFVPNGAYKTGNLVWSNNEIFRANKDIADAGATLSTTDFNKVARLHVEHKVYLPTVVDTLATTPPTSPTDGFVIIVNGVGTGVFAGQDNNFAVYDLSQTNWVFTKPYKGQFIGDVLGTRLYHFDGTSWSDVSGSDFFSTDFFKLTIPDFSNTKNYISGELVVQNAIPYRANTGITAGPFTATDWDALSSPQEVKFEDRLEPPKFAFITASPAVKNELDVFVCSADINVGDLNGYKLGDIAYYKGGAYHKISPHKYLLLEEGTTGNYYIFNGVDWKLIVDAKTIANELPVGLRDYADSTAFHEEEVCLRGGIIIRCVKAGGVLASSSSYVPADWLEISAGKIRPWATTTEYVVDDLTITGEKLYFCKTAHTSGATFLGDIANWVLIGAPKLEELKDVDILTTPSKGGDVLAFDRVDSKYKNKSLGEDFDILFNSSSEIEDLKTVFATTGATAPSNGDVISKVSSLEFTAVVGDKLSRTINFSAKGLKLFLKLICFYKLKSGGFDFEIKVGTSTGASLAKGSLNTGGDIERFSQSFDNSKNTGSSIYLEIICTADGVIDLDDFSVSSLSVADGGEVQRAVMVAKIPNGAAVTANNNMPYSVVSPHWDNTSSEYIAQYDNGAIQINGGYDSTGDATATFKLFKNGVFFKNLAYNSGTPWQWSIVVNDYAKGDRFSVQTTAVSGTARGTLTSNELGIVETANTKVPVVDLSKLNEDFLNLKPNEYSVSWQNDGTVLNVSPPNAPVTVDHIGNGAYRVKFAGLGLVNKVIPLAISSNYQTNCEALTNTSFNVSAYNVNSVLTNSPCQATFTVTGSDYSPPKAAIIDKSAVIDHFTVNAKTDGSEYRTSEMINDKWVYARTVHWTGSVGGAGVDKISLAFLSAGDTIVSMNGIYKDSGQSYYTISSYEGGPYTRVIRYNDSTYEFYYEKNYVAAVYTTTNVNATIKYLKP